VSKVQTAKICQNSDQSLHDVCKDVICAGAPRVFEIQDLATWSHDMTVTLPHCTSHQPSIGGIINNLPTTFGKILENSSWKSPIAS
jgi:hypothetical protein